MSNDLVPGDADDLIRKLIEEREKAPDLSALGQSLLSEFGGHKGIAHELKLEYQNSPSGGQNRTYILRCAVELLKAAALKGGVDPLAGLSNEELAAALRRAKKNG